MLKRLLAIFLVMCTTLTLQGCTSLGGGLNAFVDDIDGYRFLYPNGWVQIAVSNGPDVVFHDIIEQTENVSVVINPVPGRKTLSDLGTPGEVGYQLSNSAIAPPGSGRTAELVDAQERDVNGRIYYTLEYLVKLSDGRERHNLASASISRGKLFTINASTPEGRWADMQDALQRSVQSFLVN
ncbi:photosystem II reaction center PsbP family protein [filamentous cyanobacterium LEGE 11480]|uniref:Photosystem II reaction center PsbP family protein n=1 Tax=Romeriopsis navalis LEGE 11480 TaxID=2777977 RepID=A0A928Z528_9CYAN|nr:photosystem II reaction center PsbP [Romeriopsis navalis]MBE9030815.1 photosystem II reaction center PsbP family protein [Romeriopsis navalis LEGE 11480]